MFCFLVRGMCFKQFSLAIGDGFLCLESPVLLSDKWQESEKQPASWVEDIACGRSLDRVKYSQLNSYWIPGLGIIKAMHHPKELANNKWLSKY